VDGEEDLSVIPALILLPSGFTICYGQLHAGMVVVPVNKQTKNLALNIVKSFSHTRGH